MIAAALSLFTPSRAAIVAAAVAIALAGTLWLRLDAARSRADLADSRAAAATARAHDLADALAIQSAAEARARMSAAAAQAAAREARIRFDALRAAADTAPDSDDGPVAPVLLNALNALRKKGK